MCRSMTQSLILVLSSIVSSLCHANSSSFAIIGDAGKYTAATQLVQESITRAEVSKLILPGDNLYTGTYAEQWSPWKGFDFSIVAIGNHHDGYANEMAYFKMPGEYFAKEVDGARFLVLNSDNSDTVDEQADWLETQLKAKNVQPTFLVWHHPPYTVTAFHNWREKASFQKRLRNLMKQYRDRIAAILVGHDHIGAVYCLDTLPMIVSGAIWETRRAKPQHYIESDGTKVSAQWVYPQGTHVWGRLDIDEDTKQSTISFIQSADDKVVYQTRLGVGNAPGLCQTTTSIK